MEDLVFEVGAEAPFLEFGTRTLVPNAEFLLVVPSEADRGPEAVQVVVVVVIGSHFFL